METSQGRFAFCLSLSLPKQKPKPASKQASLADDAHSAGLESRAKIQRENRPTVTLSLLLPRELRRLRSDFSMGALGSFPDTSLVE